MPLQAAVSTRVHVGGAESLPNSTAAKMKKSNSILNASTTSTLANRRLGCARARSLFRRHSAPAGAPPRLSSSSDPSKSLFDFFFLFCSFALFFFLSSSLQPRRLQRRAQQDVSRSILHRSATTQQGHGRIQHTKRREEASTEVASATTALTLGACMAVLVTDSSRSSSLDDPRCTAVACP